MEYQRQQEQLKRLKNLSNNLALAEKKMLDRETERAWAKRSLQLAETLVPYTAQNNGLSSKPRAEILRDKSLAYFNAYFQYQCLGFERNLFGLYLGLFTKEELKEKQKELSQLIEEQMLNLKKLEREFESKYGLVLNLDFSAYRQKIVLYQAAIDLTLLLQLDEVQKNIRTLEVKPSTGYFNFFRQAPQDTIIPEESCLENLLSKHFGLSLETHCPIEEPATTAESWNSFFNFLSHFFGFMLGQKTKAEKIQDYLEHELKPALEEYLHAPETSSEALTRVIHQGLAEFLPESKVQAYPDSPGQSV